MIRGKTKFKCDDCGHTFKAFDIELAATVYSQPMPCPKCGSRHTMPVSFFGCTDRETYMKIWEMMDKKWLYRFCPWIAHANLLAKYHRATVHYSK